MSLIQFVPKNTIGRDFVCGDIHGCFRLLARALRKNGFDNTKDRLFVTGDLCDRGPQCRDLLKWLSWPWFYSVMGNHDDKAIRYVNGTVNASAYAKSGGGWLVDWTKNKQERVRDALVKLPLVLEIDTDAGPVGIVHADCPFESWTDFKTYLQSDLSNTKLKSLKGRIISDRLRFQSGIASTIDGVHQIYCGHSTVSEVTIRGNISYVDTGLCYGGDIKLVRIQ